MDAWRTTRLYLTQPTKPITFTSLAMMTGSGGHEEGHGPEEGLKGNEDSGEPAVYAVPRAFHRVR